MNISKMRHKLILQEFAGSADGGGGKSKKWLAAAVIWADVNTLKTDAVIKARQAGQETTHLIKVRYRNDLATHRETPKRFLLNGKVLRIETIVNVDEANREMHISCVEDLSNG